MVWKVALLVLAVSGLATAGVAKALPPLSTSDSAGPAAWDGTGRVRCSVGDDSFARTCGYRVVHHRDTAVADIWIRNLAKNKSVYRVLRFSGAAFATNEKADISSERRGEEWAVRVDGREYYLIRDSILRAQPVP